MLELQPCDPVYRWCDAPGCDGYFVTCDADRIVSHGATADAAIQAAAQPDACVGCHWHPGCSSGRRVLPRPPAPGRAS
jgi:hypothetical protein